MELYASYAVEVTTGLQLVNQFSTARNHGSSFLVSREHEGSATAMSPHAAFRTGALAPMVTTAFQLSVHQRARRTQTPPLAAEVSGIKWSWHLKD